LEPPYPGAVDVQGTAGMSLIAGDPVNLSDVTGGNIADGH